MLNTRIIKIISSIVLFVYFTGMLPLDLLTGPGRADALNPPWGGSETQTQIIYEYEDAPPTPSDPPDCGDCPCPQSAQQSPVYIKSGNLNLPVTDIAIPGRGYGLRVERSYNNQEMYDGPVSYGWSFNLTIRMIPVTLWGSRTIIICGGGLCTTITNRWITAKLMVIRWSSGRRWVYQQGADGSYTSITRGVTLRLVENPDGTFTLNPQSECLSCLKSFEYTYSFDPDGFLTSIVDRNGNSVLLTHDSSHRLLSASDDAGRTLSFSYTERNKIATISDPAGRTWTYSYDDNGNLIGVTDPLGRTTRYSYDTTYSRYGARHNLLSITDPRGNTTLEVEYDDKDRVVGYTENGQTSTYSYDPDNNTTTKTTPDGIYTFVYDDDGNLLNKTYPDGTTWSQTLTEDLHLAGKTDRNGVRTEYSYDDLGNMITKTEAAGTPLERITTYAYGDTLGLVTSITDPLGDTTSYEYDANGNRTNEIDALGNEMSSTYGTNGDLTSISDANGNTTTLTHNEYGYLTGVTDAVGNVRTYEYDILGNLALMTDENGNTTEYVYDQANQLTQITNALGNTFQFEYNENGKITAFSEPLNTTTTLAYDDNNQLTTITDALGYQTFYTYDTNGNLLSGTDAEGNPTSYTYDSLDRLTSITNALGHVIEYTLDDVDNLIGIQDENGNTTSYTYDNLNRLIQTTYPDSTTETYSYDQGDNLLSKTNRKGELITYTYDNLDRVILKTYPDSTTVTYSYDSLSRIVSTVNNYSTITSTYDALNRVVQVNQDGKPVSYEYDPAGNRTRLTYPDGSYITYSYDALNRLDQIKDTSGLAIADYSYDSLGRRTLLELQNGTQTTYQYDRSSRLTNLTNTVSSTQDILSSFTYTYDNVGNRTSMATQQGVHTYSYDNIYQLSSVDYPDGFPFSDTTYNFDAVGNRTSVIDGGTGVYTSNNMNQYTDIDGTSYTYDLNGNLTSDGTNSYTFDDENRLVSATTPTATNITYQYDSLGRRIGKNVDGAITKYMYDGVRVIAEYDGSESLLAKYVHGIGIDEVLRMTRNGNEYYYHLNGLGSIANITDFSSSMEETYQYNVYGEADITSSLNNPYMFTGRRYDPETGLYYYRARYYDPMMGRFLQVDPLEFYDEINRYSYCQNDPLNCTDPLGLRKNMYTVKCRDFSSMSDEEIEKLVEEFNREADRIRKELKRQRSDLHNLMNYDLRDIVAAFGDTILASFVPNPFDLLGEFELPIGGMLRQSLGIKPINRKSGGALLGEAIGKGVSFVYTHYVGWQKALQKALKRNGNY